MELARSLPYDPALMDMTMPQPNGLAIDVPPLDAPCRREAGMTAPATGPVTDTCPRAPAAGTAARLPAEMSGASATPVASRARRHAGAQGGPHPDLRQATLPSPRN